MHTHPMRFLVIPGKHPGQVQQILLEADQSVIVLQSLRSRGAIFRALSTHDLTGPVILKVMQLARILNQQIRRLD